MAMLQRNQYSSIPEHTFDNASNLTYLTLGDWLPVVKTDNGWELDPQSESGKAIAKLKEVSPDVTLNISVGNGLGITNGQYCGLTAISASAGTVVGTPMQERNLSLMVPTGSKSVTITPQALLSDTVITVNGKEYKSGDYLLASS